MVLHCLVAFTGGLGTGAYKSKQLKPVCDDTLRLCLQMTRAKLKEEHTKAVEKRSEWAAYEASLNGVFQIGDRIQHRDSKKTGIVIKIDAEGNPTVVFDAESGLRRNFDVVARKEIEEHHHQEHHHQEHQEHESCTEVEDTCTKVEETEPEPPFVDEQIDTGSIFVVNDALIPSLADVEVREGVEIPTPISIEDEVSDKGPNKVERDCISTEAEDEVPHVNLVQDALHREISPKRPRHGVCC